jgi:hypothetical protein
MKIIVSKYLIPKGYAAMALYPFILLGSKHLKDNSVMLNHESIHLRQQAELLVLPFYVWYTAEYLIRLCLYQDRRKAYRNISFEREAYYHERDKNYLEDRKTWNFIRYL